jgi:glycerol-3-phosphate acyltransferase PlsY
MLAALLAYLLGSIPFGYLLYRLRRNEDIRETGSGNIGATNVFRTAGFLPAAATLLLDAAKGYLAVVLAAEIEVSASAIGLAAVLAIVGHCYPVFLGFMGGKGVATGLGAFLAIAPFATLLCALLFVLVAATARYVSLASICAAAAFPLVMVARDTYAEPILAAAFAGAGLIIFRHRANMQKLRAGTESRISLRRSLPR